MVRPGSALLGRAAGPGAPAGLLLAAATVLMLPAEGRALTVEEQQIREAEQASAADRGLKIGFGLDAVIDTAEGINRDRPTSSNTFVLMPQLKLGATVRVKADLQLTINHLDRDANPWDLPNWSLQVADLSLYREPVTGISLSGSLGYSLPTSIDDRTRDSWGTLRGNLGAARNLGPFRLSFTLSGLRYLSRYTTSDTSRWQESGNIASNPAWGVMETYQLSYSATDQLSFTAIWQMKQVRDHAGEASDLAGMDAGKPRRTDVWKHSFGCILDVSYVFTEHVFLSAGYGIAANQLQNGGHDLSLNPFNPKYGQIYLDLAFTY